MCAMQWTTPMNFEPATPIHESVVPPPPPPPLPPKRKVSLPKSEQPASLGPRIPLLPPRGKSSGNDNKLSDGTRRKPVQVLVK